MIRALVCGGRDFTDREFLFQAMDAFVVDLGRIEVIHGGARGADTLAGQWARSRGWPEQVFPADWDKHRLAAGPIRNRKMLIHGKPDVVLAFSGGRGTAHMVGIARAAGVLVKEFRPT